MKYIGRYAIRGLLGRGGMGRVYRVELAPIGKIGALKRFVPDALVAKMMGRARLRDMFVQEAATIASLSHPHLVSVHDFDQVDGDPFFVMDYLADNLGALIGEHYEIERRTRTLRVDRALAYTHQTLQGLSCLHDAGIVHRDIKPYNLLLTPWDTVRICDFGLSRLRGERFRGPTNLNVGSPYYAAPEQQADPNRSGPRADLYSVGVVLYRMLTGMLPDTGPSSEKYRSLTAVNPDMDAHWDAWMDRAIAGRPEARFASAEEMDRALEDLAAHWAAQKERVCAIDPDHQLAPGAAQPSVPPRSTPIKLPPRQAAAIFKLDDLWRPKRYVAGTWTADRRDNVILDRAAGLAWQRSGSPFPRTWQKARDYIRDLNVQRHAGRGGWHLPTVDELLTLLRPPSTVEDLCMPPVFDPTQRRLWSADRRSYTSAYYVDSEMGYVGWQDIHAPFYVRAVCALSTASY